jgi:hypothetical protein
LKPILYGLSIKVADLSVNAISINYKYSDVSYVTIDTIGPSGTVIGTQSRDSVFSNPVQKTFTGLNPNTYYNFVLIPYDKYDVSGSSYYFNGFSGGASTFLKSRTGISSSSSPINYSNIGKPLCSLSAIYNTTTGNTTIYSNTLTFTNTDLSYITINITPPPVDNISSLTKSKTELPSILVDNISYFVTYSLSIVPYNNNNIGGSEYTFNISKSNILDSCIGLYAPIWLNPNYRGPIFQINNINTNSKVNIYTNRYGTSYGLSLNGTGTSLTTWLNGGYGVIYRWYNQALTTNTVPTDNTNAVSYDIAFTNRNSSNTWSPILDTTNKKVNFNATPPQYKMLALAYVRPVVTEMFIPSGRNPLTILLKHDPINSSTNSSNNYRGLFENGNGDGSLFFFEVNNSNYVIRYANNSMSTGTITNIATNTGNLNTVAFIYDGTTLSNNVKLYVNNSLNQSTTFTSGFNMGHYNSDIFLGGTISGFSNNLLNTSLYYASFFKVILSDKDKSILSY